MSEKDHPQGKQKAATADFRAGLEALREPGEEVVLAVALHGCRERVKFASCHCGLTKEASACRARALSDIAAFIDAVVKP